MPAPKSLLRLMVSRIAMGAVAAILLVIAARLMHFPQVFQIMFVLYIALGLVVFLLLNAPAVRMIGGWKAAAALVVFYVVLSAAYVLGASVLPQYNPSVEKDKIDKIVKPKMETPEHRQEPIGLQRDVLDGDDGWQLGHGGRLRRVAARVSEDHRDPDEGHNGEKNADERSFQHQQENEEPGNCQGPIHQSHEGRVHDAAPISRD